MKAAGIRGLARRGLRVLSFAFVLWLALSVGAVVLLRFVPPLASAVMLEDWLGARLQGDAAFALHYRWTSWDRVSKALPIALVAAEDQKFPFHHGFDFDAIQSALAEAEDGERLRGASTISQQVAKNLFLWSGRSYFRKGLEAYFTLLIEACWPKRRILEVYLNIAEFGHGIYGAEAAAQHFFHMPASRLTRSDAAVLAAVLPNPQRLSAAAPSAYVQQRRAWILAQMQGLGGPEMLQEIDAYPTRRH